MKAYQMKDFIVEPKTNISKRMIYKDKNVIAFILNIAKGATLPNHTHYESTVLVQILQGQGNVIADGNPISSQTGDIIEINGEENMAIENIGNDNLVVYVTISPNPPSDKYSNDADI